MHGLGSLLEVAEAKDDDIERKHREKAIELPSISLFKHVINQSFIGESRNRKLDFALRETSPLAWDATLIPSISAFNEHSIITFHVVDKEELNLQV